MLLGTLVDRCSDTGLILIPPTLLTPIDLPNHVIGASACESASLLTRRIAWIETLNSVDQEVIRSLAPTAPSQSGWDRWSSLADWIHRISSELGDSGLLIHDVLEHIQDELEGTERTRWETLSRLQTAYIVRLASIGIVDERLDVLERVTQTHVEFDSPERHLIFVGLSELGSIARSALQRGSCRIDALVYAPRSMSSMFDELGCVDTKSWLACELDIPEERIVFTPDIDSMCEHSLAALADSQGVIDSSSSVIGVTDESLFRALDRTARQSSGSISLHSANGHSAQSTPPAVLIAKILTYLTERTFDSFMDIVRHPAVESALQIKFSSVDAVESDQKPTSHHKAFWLKSLDLIRQDHVQTGKFQIPAGTESSIAEDARAVHAAITEFLLPLTQDDARGVPERSLMDWLDRCLQSLRLIYDGAELDPDNEQHASTLEGLESIRVVYEEAEHAQNLGQHLQELESSSALSLLLNRLGEIQLSAESRWDSVETLGWLELMLDPAPRCVVMGMDEAFVPGSITHDPLLPGTLRSSLGMVSNEDRFARDLYFMNAIHASRDSVFLCARASNQGDPITPSRLILRAKGPELAARIQRFVGHDGSQSTLPRIRKVTHPGVVDRFAPKLVVDTDYTPPISMSVTDFDAYLKSPALWYLQRRRKLNDLDLSIRELSPILMGNLVHSVFDAFGKDPALRELDDAGDINVALKSLLNGCVRAQFGSTLPAAISVQTELIQYRFAWFAREQSKRKRAGWSIVHSEWSPNDSASPMLDVDDEPMGLRGKIDRIDLHDDGRVAIIDYKTGKFQNAQSAHYKDDRWIKLQLPLYRILAADLLDGRTPEFGYIGLPTKESDPVMDFAYWSESELKNADEAARDVVRSIRSLQAGEIIPMGEHPPKHGALGFVTGQRFETGGLDIHDDSE
ncbi:MAG: PD-(D/E)XK nuclease family protein, partial [Phycisphaerales bacterium]|nr:PD-(D/E)XK nuclease family protein [Phycisphaerales bacterium]